MSEYDKEFWGKESAQPQASQCCELLVCDACDGEGYIPEQECCGNGWGNECCGCPDTVWAECAKCEGNGKEIK